MEENKNNSLEDKLDDVGHILLVFSYSPLHNHEANNITIYGTNKYDYLDITIRFYSLRPVTQVKVSELTCEVKNIY